MHFNIMKEILIDNRLIGQQHPAFIIAELSGNHNQSLETALMTIDAMHEAGADCVKLQTSKPDSITINCDKEPFLIKGGTLWDNKSLYSLYKETNTPWEWHKQIKDYVESLNMIFFSSPFSNEAVDFLEELDVPAYKIASFEITDIPLIEYTASKGKPVIISTGIATKQDIQEAVEACVRVGNNKIALLKCTSAYPTPWDEVNLSLIKSLESDFNVVVGISDHTLGDVVPLGAVSLGARIIEKHFILDRSLGGPDSKFSMEPHEFKEMVKRVRILEKSIGISTYEISPRVEKNRQFARSLFVVENIKKGELITNTNVRSIRPGYGIRPKHMKNILGKKVNQDLDFGTPMSFDYID